MYQVIENAGMVNEREVFEGSFSECEIHIGEFYDQDELDDMGIDILKNGSTEY